MKSIIYYTDNRLDEKISLIAQKLILASKLPVVSCSLKPIDFGKNIVLDLEPSIITMFKQILTALENSTADIVFFCEHDVLYHKSHFKFTPPRDDTFYYNVNVWRWNFLQDRAITYDFVRSTSGLWKLLVDHYRKRLKTIEENNLKDGRDPRWARKMGYEPSDICENWKSEYPNIDIRHRGTITPHKTTLKEFKHKPDNWREKKIEEIKGWDLKKLFHL